MKRTKTIIKKNKKQTKTAKTQKQKQSVNVNVNIDQSKRSLPRKQKSTSTASNLPTSMQSGQKILSMPPAFIYQPPINTQYGLQPLTNQSNSLNKAIENEQNYARHHSLVPSNNYSQYPFLLIQIIIHSMMQMKNNELKMKLNQQHKYLNDTTIKNTMLKKSMMNDQSMTLMKMKMTMKKMFQN